jgi:hypothetical protein
MNPAIPARSARHALAPLLAAFAALTAPALLAVEPELPPILSAAALLDPAELASPVHRVREQVPTDGYMAYFTIDSDYGLFDCVGLAQARHRIDEIRAIKELVEVSRGELFAKGLKQSLNQPLDAVKNVVNDPVGSVKAVPGTVGHIFKKVGNSVSGAARNLRQRDEEPETVPAGAPGTGEAIAGAGRSLIGFDKARLGCAKQLQVDPYTDNARLQEEIDKVSWVFFSGGLPLRIGAMVASGGASTALGVTNLVGLPDEVYSLTPAELDLRNQEAMESFSVDSDTAHLFKNNPALSITLRSSILRALVAFGPIAGRAEVVELAANCESRRQAEFLNHALELLAIREASGKGKITGIQVMGRLLGAPGADDKLVVPVPTDYISWTAEVAEFATRDDIGARKLVLLHTGDVSPTARRGLAELGWSLETN